MIIAVEGIDGAGKNTVVEAVKGELGAETMSFPRYADSIHAQLASDALHGRMGDVVDSAYAMALLFALDRAEVRPLLDAYAGAPENLLILDRYVASNAAYTAARTGDDAALAWVADLEFGRFGLPAPDLQVLVDTPPNEAGGRVRRRAEGDATRVRDRYERDFSLQRETFAAYERLAESGWAGRWTRASDPGAIIQTVGKLV